MGPERWRRVKEHLADALERPPDERALLLERLGRQDSDLRAELEGWLALEAQADGFLAEPPPDAPRPDVCLRSGARVGRYEIVRVLGAGGSGVVYEAWQDEPRRLVALKVLAQPVRATAHSDASAGTGAPEPDRRALERFVLEARLLAGLSHPGIARVFEAGTCEGPDGLLAYIAVEHVAGARDLLAFAREEGLDLRRRLALFLRVCEAVSHAHQRGVIHRDLKPANVLVGAGGGAEGGDGEGGEGGEPKVIDFGIAVLAAGVQSSAGARRELPRGTLAYMSPEQCGGERPIDTRSDVYALGAMLYELCCGRLPCTTAGLPLAGALRAIREDPPPAPRSLVRGLPRDLEAVLQKALEKDPERRYSSAGELARELARLLRGEPVEARPAGLGRHALLLARRHVVATALVATLALACLASLGAAVGLWRETARTARVEARERARAEQVVKFLQSVFELARPGHGRHDLPARALLDDAALRIDVELAGNPSAQAELHSTIGRAYAELDLHTLAERHLRRSGELYALVHGNVPMVRVCTNNALGDVLNAAGKAEEAEGVLRQALAAFDECHDCPGFYRAMSATKLSYALRLQGRLAEAEALAREGLAIYAAHFPPNHAALAAACQYLSTVLQDEGEYAEAEILARRRLAIELANHGTGSYELAGAHRQLGAILAAEGCSDEARAALEAALATFERVLPPDHATLAETRALLASLP